MKKWTVVLAILSLALLSHVYACRGEDVMNEDTDPGTVDTETASEMRPVFIYMKKIPMNVFSLLQLQKC